MAEIDKYTNKDGFMRSKFIAMILLSLVCFSSCTYDRIRLTEEEQAYIDTRIVNWAVDENFQPFIFMDNGVPKGMAVDYLDVIVRKTGLRIRLEKAAQLEEVLGLLRSGPVDLISSVRTTPNRARYAIFSRPFIHVDLVQLKSKNLPITAAVGRGYAVVNFLEVERKDLMLVEYPTDEVSMRALIDGEVDSAIMDVVSARTLMRKFNVEFDEVKIPFEYPLSFAVKKDNRILRSIIDKALSDMTAEENDRIRRKWM